MNQIYHKYLNLPFDVSKPDKFKDGKKNEQLFFDNTIIPKHVLEWLDSLGLRSIHTEAFYTAPNDKIFIHCDTPEIDNHVKINFTWGPNESTTRWWKLKEGKDYKRSNVEDGGGILLAQEADCDLLYEQVINKPSLINAGVLHSTYNPTVEGRWTLSLVISEKEKEELLHWNDALVFLKDYIV